MLHLKQDLSIHSDQFDGHIALDHHYDTEYNDNGLCEDYDYQACLSVQMLQELHLSSLLMNFLQV